MQTATSDRPRATAVVTVACLVLWVILSALGLHGFSISVWHESIDASPQTEIVVGTARSIRSDDYVAVLPQILSQRADNPPFPAVNHLIGDGHCNMVINYAMPVRHWITLFRPQVWGYFAGADFGLAWNWWFNVLGSWLAAFFLLRLITRRDIPLSVAGATALVFSPFFQYWSLNCAPAVIFAASAVIGGAGILVAESSAAAIGSFLLFVWSACSLLVTFSFTPYVIVLAYLVVFVLAGITLEYQRPRDRRRLIVVLAGIAAAAAVLLAVLIESRDVVTVIRNSIYPGHRTSAGGAESLANIFRCNIFALAPARGWTATARASAASGFILLSPLVFFAVIWDGLFSRRKPNRLVMVLAGYLILLLLWNIAGFPNWLSKWTLLNRVPERRSLLGIGVADLLSVVAYFAESREPISARKLFAITAVWVAFNAWVGWSLHSLYPGYSLRTALVGIVAVSALGKILLARPRLGLCLVAAASIWSTADFNPLVRGGTDFIYHNPLSAKIVELDLAAAKQSVWVTYGDLPMDICLPNLFRMIGVRCLNGVHAYPQFGLWQKLDPDGASRDAYNRYAHVVFCLPPTKDDMRIKLVQQDLVMVQIHPDNPRFATLGVDYILYSGKKPDAFAAATNLQEVFEYAGKRIYAVRGSPPHLTGQR